MYKKNSKNAPWRRSVFAVAIALCACSSLSAVSFSLDVLDHDVVVGESFEVDVSAQLADGEVLSLGDLVVWGFEVDPGSLLSSIQFNGATVASPFFDVSGGLAGNVSGVLPFEATTGADVPLATLSFTALSIGLDDLQIVGLVSDILGAGFLFGQSPVDIVASTRIEVRANAVSDSGSYVWMFPSVLIGLAAFRRRLS